MHLECFGYFCKVKCSIPGVFKTIHIYDFKTVLAKDPSEELIINNVSQCDQGFMIRTGRILSPLWHTESCEAGQEMDILL